MVRVYNKKRVFVSQKTNNRDQESRVNILSLFYDDKPLSLRRINKHIYQIKTRVKTCLLLKYKLRLNK